MPRLASIAEFAEHFNTTADAEVKPTIARALDLSTHYMAHILECSFDKATVIDYFTVDNRHPRIFVSKLILRLSSGFLLDAPDVTLRYRANPIDDFSDATAAMFMVDRKKGIVTVDEHQLLADVVDPLSSVIAPARWDFQVEYSHGYDSESDEGHGTKYIDSLQALKDLCIIQAVEVYNLLAEEEPARFSVLASSHALDRYTRFHSARVMPYYTAEV